MATLPGVTSKVMSRFKVEYFTSGVVQIQIRQVGLTRFRYGYRPRT
jgi:hypothetical protein